MTEFEKALQECLRRYPKFAQELEPVLLTSAYLQRGRAARPSAAFKARVCANAPSQSSCLCGLSMVAGAVYAQGALPGSSFYSWKLTSENVWRAVGPDPVGIDLAIAGRRMDELIAVRDDPELYPQALKAYHDVVDRLKSEVDAENEARILDVLDTQIEELNQSGIISAPIDQNVLPPSNGPTEEPTVVPPSTSTATPLPVLDTPRVNPTDLPNVIPTIKVPSEIIPTIEISPPIP